MSQVIIPDSRNVITTHPINSSTANNRSHTDFNSGSATSFIDSLFLIFGIWYLSNLVPFLSRSVAKTAGNIKKEYRGKESSTGGILLVFIDF